MKKSILILSGILLTNFVIAQSNPKKDENSDNDFKKHAVMVNPIMIWYGTLTLGYENFHKSQMRSFKIPFTFNINKEHYLRYIETSFDYRFYLTNPEFTEYGLGPMDLGLSQFRYFLGPSVLFINYKTTESENLMGIKLTTGVTYQHIKGYYLAIYLNIGPQFYLNEHKEEDKDKNLVSVFFDIGWRF